MSSKLPVIKYYSNQSTTANPIKEIGTLQLVQCTVFILYIILQFHNV